MSRVVRRFTCSLVMVAVICVTLTSAAVACGGGGGGGGGGKAKGSQGWVEARSSLDVREAIVAGRSVEKAAEAMNEAKQASLGATAGAVGKGEKDERLQRLAREVLELARQYEELATIAVGKLATTQAVAESKFAASPAEFYKSKLDSMSDKVKIYKEQAQAILS